MTTATDSADARVAELEALVASLATERSELSSKVTSLTSERDALASKVSASAQRVAELEEQYATLRATYEQLRIELELLKKRLFVASAERVDTAELKREFADKLRKLEEVAKTLGIGEENDASADDEPRDDEPSTNASGQAPSSPRKPRRKPTGRRDLRKLSIQEHRVELTDPDLEKLVAEGKVVRHGVEESCQLMRVRAGMMRIVIARAKYRATDEVNEETGAMAVYTTPMPPQLFERSIATPSLVAHVASRKVTEGMPLFRIEDSFLREGTPIARSVMARWLEYLGATLGSTIVRAMLLHAKKTAFCIATDATGFCVLPIRTHEKQRRPCKKGHYLVLIADRDHVIFEYLERETSAAIADVFRGYAGYVQADAKSVYERLYSDPDDGCERTEVGCWSHARTKFWEATAAKSAVAREGLARIGRIFELDATWKDKSPAEKKRLRDEHLRPHVDAFLEWVEEEYAKVRHERSILSRALGYASRQKPALVAFFEDGRLVLENNRSERELRRIAVGRKAFLFAGSDDHAASLGHIFTMVASARLHGLDPETYLRDIIRVLPHWPRERYLELAPLFWAQTRTRLDPVELAAEIGWLRIPPPLRATTEEQAPG